MTDKERKVRTYQKAFEEAKTFLEKKYDKTFTSHFLSTLLGHHFDSKDVHIYLISNTDFNPIDLKSILNEMESAIGSLEFNSSDFDFIISDKIEKARIKENGLIWIIHNSDKDPKPSQPHAHEYSLNIKIHLGTGELFEKGKKVGTLRKKEFLRLKEKIIKKGISLPKQSTY